MNMKLSDFLMMLNGLADLQIPARYQFDDGRECLQDERVQSLIVCCNCVLEELYCDFATDTACCSVTAQNGVVDTSHLPFNRVVSLKNSLGQNVKYRYTEKGLLVDWTGELLLTYARLPERLMWDDEIVLPTPKITVRIFAYGVLSEYFLATGDYQTAAVWEEKFRNALGNTSKEPIRNGTMPPVTKWC